MGSMQPPRYRIIFAIPPLLLGLTALVCGAEPKPASIPTLDLEACRQIALDKQPAIAAYRASEAAAQTKAKALEELSIATVVAHDIPIRRQQACLGVRIAQARVNQAERDTVAAVTRTYLTALYAHQQDELLDRALMNLKELQKTIDEIVNEGLRKDVTTRDKERVKVIVQLAEAKQEEAKSGYERALAGLREAMGVGPDYAFTLADKELPYPKVDVQRDAVRELALAHRPELAQAVEVNEVFTLEVKAQGKIHGVTGRTFASASDLHADAVPQGVSNSEYRPGAVGLEMPANLTGTQSARVEEAQALEARAAAVVDKTRGLIALEADDAFLRWDEAAKKFPKISGGADKAEELARNLRDDFKASAKVRIEDVIASGILAAQLRGEANETLHKYLLSLSSLERATGGGLRFDFFANGKKP
jgi:outer membrane protein TolC